MSIIETIFVEVETLLKNRMYQPEDASILKNIQEARKQIQSGDLIVSTMKSYWIFWRAGSVQVLHGVSIEDAVRRAGYGAACLKITIDFYSEIPKNECLALRKPTLPDNENARAEVVAYYLENIRIHFRDLKEKVSEKDYVHALEDFYVEYDSGIVPFPERAEFMALHQKLVSYLNPATRHGKMYYDKFFQKSTDGSLTANPTPYERNSDE